MKEVINNKFLVELDFILEKAIKDNNLDLLTEIQNKISVTTDKIEL